MITEESFVDFRCPYCGDTISFPRESAGCAQTCPNCTESVIVPEDDSGEGRKLPLPLKTPRLSLRRFTAADWQGLIACFADEEQYRYMEGAPLEEEDVLRWLERDSQVKLTTPEQVFHLGIQPQDGDKLIGYLGLSFPEPLQANLLRIVINRSHQKQGLAREALKAVLDFCFNTLHLHRVATSCDTRNATASKLFEQTGFRREGEFVQNKLFNGEWASTAHYAVLKEEFRA